MCNNDASLRDIEVFGKKLNQRRVSFAIVWLRVQIDRKLIVGGFDNLFLG